MKITPKPNGPNLVQDAPILKESDGTIIDTDKTTYGLCRCGLSKNKPFCDGTHHDVKWKAADAITACRCTIGAAARYAIKVNVRPIAFHA